MFLFWEQNLHVGSWVAGKDVGEGEQGRKEGWNKCSAYLAPLHCLSGLCVWTACKNYTTSNISFTSKSFWKSSPSSEAELPCASPTLVLNQAFICLPIGTDAKCPWHTHPPNNLNLIWGFRPSWLKKKLPMICLAAIHFGIGNCGQRCWCSWRSSCHGNIEFKGRTLGGIRIGESDNVLKACVFLEQAKWLGGMGRGGHMGNSSLQLRLNYAFIWHFGDLLA